MFKGVKDNELTKKIIDVFINLKINDINEIIDVNNNTVLLYACCNKMNDVSIKLIETFGDKVLPGQVNNNGNTTLIWACDNNMNDVAIKLIDTFGDKVLPDQVTNNGNTALIHFCYNKINDVSIKLTSKGS